MRNSITFSQLKKMIYEEGFHILLLSDPQLNKLSGLSNHPFRQDNVIKGLYLPDRNEIIINRQLDIKERVLTLIHELIHFIKPNWSEEETEKETALVYNSLNLSDLGLLEFTVSHQG